MTTKYTDHFNIKTTPQSEPIPGKAMVENSAGGFVFQTNLWDQLDRFLILGSEGGTYYIGERKLTQDNAKNVVDCIAADGLRTVRTIVDVSQRGRAPKNDPAIFALALCTALGDEATKKAAYLAITKVCRTFTYLATFCQYVQDLRGWSRGLRNGVANFYTEKSVDDVAMQMIKYRNRNGWTHQDVVRLAHPKAGNETLNGLLRYAVGKGESAHPLIQAFEEVQKLKDDPKAASKLILEFDLPREALPTELLSNKQIWESLVQNMPMTAMIRNLGKMSNVGLLDSNLSDHTKLVVEKLTNVEMLRKARVHPLALLVAMKLYQQGHGDKGGLTWDPVSKITDALNDAFYLAFETIEPTDLNWMLSVDVSGSMAWGNIAGLPITPREASAAMALVTAATEKNYETMGFSHELVKIDISPKMRLDQVIKKIESVPMGGTDCALPMIYATKNNLKVDTFAVYTDNETWFGKIHPKQALDQYRQKTGNAAKLVVVGMQANPFTIADPSDKGMLDVVGFDTAAPALMSQFAKG